MLKGKRNCLIRSALVCLLAAMLLSMPCAAYGEAGVPFIRLDKDDPDYWQGELSNVRLLAGQLYELQEMDAESGSRSRITAGPRRKRSTPSFLSLRASIQRRPGCIFTAWPAEDARAS